MEHLSLEPIQLSGTGGGVDMREEEIVELINAGASINTILQFMEFPTQGRVN